MRRLLILSLALTLALASGCAGSGRRMKSFAAESFPASSSSALVQDVVERIHSTYPPGQTALFLTGSGDFALALEDGLRNRGYTILSESEPGAMSVAWTVDRLDEGAWYLIVRMSDGYRFSRVYQDNGQTVQPAGGLSQGIF